MYRPLLLVRTFNFSRRSLSIRNVNIVCVRTPFLMSSFLMRSSVILSFGRLSRWPTVLVYLYTTKVRKSIDIAILFMLIMYLHTLIYVNTFNGRWPYHPGSGVFHDMSGQRPDYPEGCAACAPGAMTFIIPMDHAPTVRVSMCKRLFRTTILQRLTILL